MCAGWTFPAGWKCGRSWLRVAVSLQSTKASSRCGGCCYSACSADSVSHWVSFTRCTGAHVPAADHSYRGMQMGSQSCRTSSAQPPVIWLKMLWFKVWTCMFHMFSVKRYHHMTSSFLNIPAFLTHWEAQKHKCQCKHLHPYK